MLRRRLLSLSRRPSPGCVSFSSTAFSPATRSRQRPRPGAPGIFYDADGHGGEPQDDNDCLLMGHCETPAARRKAEIISDLFKNGYHLTPNVRAHAMELFQHWMLKYNRSYFDAAEKYKRFEIFLSNIQHIMKSNANKYDSARYGVNQFSDKTFEEFKSKCCGYKARKSPKPNQIKIKGTKAKNAA